MGVIAVTLAAAVYVHERRLPEFAGCNHRAACMYRPGWEDPVAVLVALGGIAVAVGIVTYRRRPASALDENARELTRTSDSVQASGAPLGKTRWLVVGFGALLVGVVLIVVSVVSR